MTKTRWAGAAAGVAFAAAISIVLLASADVPRASAQASDVTLTIQAPQSVKKGDLAIPIVINVENAKNLAAFQFDLKFDANIFAVDPPDPGKPDEAAQRGDFLTSTNRQAVCNQANSDGLVRMQCVTLSPTPPGPDGSGTLATVFLKAIGSGKTDLSLGRLIVNQVVLNPVEIVPTSSPVTLKVKGGGGGFNWLLWGPVIGVVALVVVGGGAFGAMRMRGASATSATAA